jgi:hypothetical protein
VKPLQYFDSKLGSKRLLKVKTDQFGSKALKFTLKANLVAKHYGLPA